MNTMPTLEAVQAAFQHLRQNKPHLRSRIPDTLRDKAVALIWQDFSGQYFKRKRSF